MAWWRDLSVVMVLMAVIIAPLSAQKKRKPVSTTLTAKWGQTPFVLEVMQFLKFEVKFI